jgi:hypothetical protein
MEITDSKRDDRDRDSDRSRSHDRRRDDDRDRRVSTISVEPESCTSSGKVSVKAPVYKAKEIYEISLNIVRCIHVI